MTVSDVKVLRAAAEVTLQNASVACESTPVRLNENVLDIFYAQEFSWVLEFIGCQSSACILASSSTDQKVVFPKILKVPSIAFLIHMTF
jgi:hypothetical protein